MTDLELKRKINKIKLVITDVDGILTNGTIKINSNGLESKSFHVNDGYGIALAKLAKIPVAFLSGRDSDATTHRAKELNIKYCIQGKLNKIEGYKQIKDNYNVKDEDICYIGDGLIDFPPMKRSGLAVTVQNGHPEIKDIADFVINSKGGTGVISELIEWILKNQNRYDKTILKMKKIYIDD